MPTHRITTRFALGDHVTWSGEKGTRFVVTRVLIELRQGFLGDVVTYGLEDLTQPRTLLIWGLEPDCAAAE